MAIQHLTSNRLTPKPSAIKTKCRIFLGADLSASKSVGGGGLTRCVTHLFLFFQGDDNISTLCHNDTCLHNTLPHTPPPRHSHNLSAVHQFCQFCLPYLLLIGHNDIITSSSLALLSGLRFIIIIVVIIEKERNNFF